MSAPKTEGSKQNNGAVRTTPCKNYPPKTDKRKPNNNNEALLPTPSSMSLQKAEDRKPNKKEAVLSNAYNCTELTEALMSIKRVVECSSCHRQLRSLRVCLSGHGICPGCSKRNHWLCSLCKTYIDCNDPVLLSKIIRLLPRVCQFSQNGCSSLILASDYDHEATCRFRPTECRMHSCKWQGLATDLLAHLESCHHKEVIRTASQTLILMSFSTEEDREGLTAFVAYNNIFWQHVRVRQCRLVQVYQYVPMEKPRVKFSVMVTFHTPETNYSSTTPVHVDSFNYRKLFFDKDTFVLPKKVAASFNRFHSGVHYSVQIIKKDL